MALARFEHDFTDALGNLIGVAGTVEVRREDTGALAIPYSDRNGTTALGNPFSVADGQVAFHVVGGSYKVTLTYGAETRTLRYQAIGTGAEYDAEALGKAGYAYEFETATTAPPSVSSIRANNADLSLATKLYIDDETLGGSDVSSTLISLDPSGNVARDRIRLTVGAVDAVFQVDGTTDQGSYVELDVSGHDGSTSLPTGTCRVNFEWAGEYGYGAVATALKSELLAITGKPDYTPGYVWGDPTPGNNGQYAYDLAGSTWTKIRSLPDTATVLQSVSGTNTITASVGTGVDPAVVSLFILVAAATNTGAMTLAVNGGSPQPFRTYAGAEFASGAIVAGRSYLVYDTGSEYRALNDDRILPFQGAYAGGTTYELGDLVESGGSIWYSLQDSNLGNTPTEGAYWTEFLPGVSVADGSITEAKLASSLQAEAIGPDNVAALLASTATYTAGTIIITREEGFAYEAVAGTGNLGQTNAGGQEFHVLPVNGEYDARAFGAAISETNANNRAFIRTAILAADGDGGGVVLVASGIDYGFQNTNALTTQPDLTGLTNDVTIVDCGIADADGSGNKAGAQIRTFYGTAQTVSPGQHDGNGTRIYGDWHPYYAVMTTADLEAVGHPSRTAYDNYRASFLIEMDGQTSWRLGQGTLAGAGYTKEELSNFVLEHYATTGDTLPNYAPLVIERKTGNWSFGIGTNAPSASYYFKSVTAGYNVATFESLSTTADLRLKNSAADEVSLKNVSGDFVINFPSVGDAVTVDSSTRYFGLGTTPSYRLDVAENKDNGFAANIKNSSSTNGNIAILDSGSAAGVGWDALRIFAASQSNEIFRFRGDGTGTADVGFSGGGADYAEMFEWADGNPNDEDRRGISVVLHGDKIMPCKDGEKPFGIVSVSPSIVGNNPLSWPKKWVTDEFGARISDDDGAFVVSDEYDSKLSYVNRADRPEWAAIGLVGRLPLLKGQPVAGNWIRLKSFNDRLDEWLVR